MITTEYVRSVFDYDSEIGELRWKISTGRRAKIGEIAGWKAPGRYCTTRLNGHVSYIHRLVWLWHGKELSGFIDHIDGDPHNNRIENLRIATPSQNCFNQRMRSDNKSGLKGVNWVKRLKKWQVRLYVNNQIKHFGLFADLELAELVVTEARNKYHGVFARHS